MTKRRDPDEESEMVTEGADFGVTMTRPSSSPPRSLFTRASRKFNTEKRQVPADCRSSKGCVVITGVVVKTFSAYSQKEWDDACQLKREGILAFCSEVKEGLPSTLDMFQNIFVFDLYAS